MFRINKGVLTLAIPAVLSLITVLKHSVVLLVLLIISHFIIIKFVPVFKGKENVWMFVFVAISSIPINFYIMLLLNKWDLLFTSFFALGVLRCILYYLVLFSMEEIIMGITTRVIWRKQYKLDL